MKHTTVPTFFVLSIILASCSLDAPLDLGKSCPPASANSQSPLGYIIDSDGNKIDASNPDYAKYFEIRTCPAASGLCQLDDNQTFYCMAPCPEGQIAINARCIDPMSDDTFCGATQNNAETGETTPNGDDCASRSERCLDGKCTGNCIEGDTRVKPNTLHHCGKCDNPCPEHAANEPNSVADHCNDGQCHYTCAEQFENCGTDTAPKCIQTSVFMTDTQNCGACGFQCADTEMCRNGRCIDKTCTDNMCIIQNDDHHDSCFDTADKCGTACIDCNTYDHAASGRCENNQCIADSCADNYHLDNGKCIDDNNIRSCGKDATDCYKQFPGMTSGKCENGNCILVSCNEGFHIFNNTCEQDSLQHCGDHNTACDAQNIRYSVDVDCIDGKCQATACCGEMSNDHGDPHCSNDNTDTHYVFAILCDGKCILENTASSHHKASIFKTECSLCRECESEGNQQCEYSETERHTHGYQSQSQVATETVSVYEPYCQ